MTWSDEYKIGLPVIDSQHKRLFKLIDELNEAIETGPEITDVEELLAGLKQYATRHFQLEEKYMVNIEIKLEQLADNPKLGRQRPEIRPGYYSSLVFILYSL